MTQKASRMEHIQAHFFADYSEKIISRGALGHDVIRLDIGSPDMPPAPQILDHFKQWIDQPDVYGYQSHRGTDKLRQAWADMYLREFNVSLDPKDEVMPLLGSKEGIFHLMLALIDTDDVVLVPDPSYPTYMSGVCFAGGRPFALPLLVENDFLPNLADIPKDIARRAKVIWLNYPNNPTASVASLAFFAEAVEFCREFDLLLCHDAAYSQVTYDNYQAPSILQIPGAKNVAVEFNSLSKSHNMAGMRVGACVGNPDILAHLHKLKSNVDSSHFLPTMAAVAFALTADQTWIKQRNEIYRERRDVIVNNLIALGLSVTPPLGSLYVWSAIPARWTSMEFADLLLETADISVTPGSVFGQHGEGYIRISLTSPVERITEAMQRFTDFWVGENAPHSIDKG
ncbi:MAG: aminotransferase class I/II-fold pyridoxal phosphate-dependent enzyme [Anaerolineae bacterium]|nr:aminotransferase class I/II-fold pyridoxal phosphate-dependent enzyme [Anaerolineae bacterium]